MHFYENNTIHNHEFIIGAYFQCVVGSSDPEWTLTSIQLVRNLSPYQVNKFIQCFDYIFPKKAHTGRNYKPECWYKFNIQFMSHEPHDFVIRSVENVSDSDNEYDRIH